MVNKVAFNVRDDNSPQEKKNDRKSFICTFAQKIIRSFGELLEQYTTQPAKLKAVDPLFGASSKFKRDEFVDEKSKEWKDGEVIVDQFFDTEGKELGREVVNRIKTVEIYKRQLNSELGYLQSCDVYDKSNQKTIQQKINLVEKKIKQANQMQSEWASTNSGRHIFSKFSKEEAKEIGVPVIANLRQYQIQFEDKGISMNGSGAITDLCHSETNLMEIVDFKYLTQLDPSEKPLDLKLRHFKDYYGVDIGDLSSKLNLIGLLQNRIKRAYGASQISQINEIEDDRRATLQRQVLQDLLVHFSANPADKQQICYSRLAYLDPTKTAATDKETDYHIEERNQFLDMKLIYDELDGAELVFDLKSTDGPYIDLQGRIHMPSNCSNDKLENRSPIILNTLFLNCSVQNNKKNEGLQWLVNRDFIIKARMLPLNEQQRKKAIEIENELMNAKETSFDLAHELAAFLKDISYLSADCYGGKDRTGYAMALETYYAMRSVVRKKANADPAIRKNYSQIMSNIRLQLVGPRGVAVRVAQDNTGCKALKISPFMLKLYISGKGLYFLRGISKRLSDYLLAARMFLPKPLFAQPTRHDDSILFDNEKEIERLRKQLAA